MKTKLEKIDGLNTFKTLCDIARMTAENGALDTRSRRRWRTALAEDPDLDPEQEDTYERMAELTTSLDCLINEYGDLLDTLFELSNLTVQQEVEHLPPSALYSCKQPHEADEWIAKQWTGKLVMQTSGIPELVGRKGRVVETLFDEKGALHCLCARDGEDAFWCSASMLREEN